MERIASYGSGKSVIVEAPERVSIIDHAQTHETSFTPLAMGGSISARDKMGFGQEVADFLRAVRGESKVRTPASDALETHRLIHRILVTAGLPGMDA
jgi:virulence factor